MQLTPRYLVANHNVLIIDEFVTNTEYNKVYQRNLKVNRGIDNTLTFEIKNADHKPVSILSTYTPYLHLFDEDGNIVKEYTGTIKETSTPNFKGQFTVTITDNDLLNYKSQYMSFTVYLTKTSDSTNAITYADTQFGVKGTIEVVGSAFPGAKDSTNINTFLDSISSVAESHPEQNANEALHTAAIYSTGFAGTVTIQATLSGSSDTSNWADLGTVTLSSPTAPIPYSFNGVFNYVRFKFANDSGNSGTIDKILYRN